MAARVFGIWQKGTVQEGRGARGASSCHEVTEKERGCELPRWWCALWKKKRVEKSKPRFGSTGSPGKGWKTPLLGGAQEVLVRGMGSS